MRSEAQFPSRMICNLERHASLHEGLVEDRRFKTGSGNHDGLEAIKDRWAQEGENCQSLPSRRRRTKALKAILVDVGYPVFRG